MLDNPFLVPSLCKLNHISLCFIQISSKSPAKLLIPFRESNVFFEVIPGVLGRSVNFNITKISIKTVRVSRLSVTCDYAFTKRFTNNSLLSRDKTISCLNWLVTCFRFQNLFWKNINCFRFWWKSYTKYCTSNYVISRVKTFSSPALSGWSGAFNFRVWSGKRKNVV